jgi:hypothetical protein
MKTKKCSKCGDLIDKKVYEIHKEVCRPQAG